MLRPLSWGTVRGYYPFSDIVPVYNFELTMALPLFFLLLAALASGYVPSQRTRENGFSLPTVARAFTGVSHISPSGEELKRCRCIPGDSCWPSPAEWDSLNKTVHGRLISTVPVSQVCHFPNYDEASCNALKTSWVTPEPQYVNFLLLVRSPSQDQKHIQS